MALAIVLGLALACTPQAPPAATQDDSARTQAAEAQAAAEAAQATAAQAAAAAEAAAQAATEAAATGASNAEALQDQAAAAQAAAEAAQATAVQAVAAAEAAVQAAAEAVRQGEDRPSIQVIGSGSGGTGTGTGTGTGSASGTGTGTGTGSVSGTGTGTGSATGTAIAAMMSQKEGGLYIPTGLSYETEGPTASDGYYTATTNREIYAKISNVIRGRREAENYSDAQKRQAVNKGMLRILYHWAKFYMIIGQERSSSRLIDEAWAVYVGEEVNGRYPNSLAALAQAREGNFGRQGTIDIPLRQAMDRARQTADDGNAAALETATNEVYSRFNAMFYPATVRYIGRVADDAAAGDRDALGTHQVEALAFYQSIQPDVAKADSSADETIMAYLTADGSEISNASRDRVLAALNGVASDLMLTGDDLITEYTDDTSDGSGGTPSPDTGELDRSSGFFIPVNLPHETDRSVPSPSDGYYYATTNREHYQKIPSDYQEIAALTNVIKDGEPLPAADIFLLYEVGYHTRIGVRSKTLRGFARDPERAEEFPLAAEFYGSSSFLDSPINNAIRERREAENYTDAQKRQAINKGVLRILYHWSKRYVIGGCADLDSGDVDEGWGIYVGLPGDDGTYPYSLSALARSREGNFGREGTIDIPLSEALERVRQAAENGDSAACDAAAQEVYSRYNALFYLATVRYIGISQQDVADGKDPGTHQVEALAFYQSIQPEVAQADPSVDETIMAYVTADPSDLTVASRDAALAALNSVASALMLTQSDLVTGY
ncbi:MAG: hypothetical protein OXL37_00505 [Chloroflexota bacterium]|nr:hypothetical protein [Chloroflexota bacterium]MDE2959811.1 hypothetical protein [Chloroflexota bacterium]